ncbi:hypothetical protein ASG29_00640 [Sphingomonas sp. Leaf412]|uniref:DUF983 domain-containing protein n=1 Tax=Sphingomonas sp. Leaf412 TaxID=1736370 RepID=UPI0006FFB93A|nr:DUF983 domain-containing protein [Sphingomonas sp. Leaf412]KQT34706.1 hypothetical protein ASG29_00640 [Sphingomonas sp. Leaf412]
MDDDRALPAPRPIDTGLKGACPRCGEKTVFAGFARFADTCPACGLRFSEFNVGDGPAAFLTLIIGTIVVALAITVELSFTPPWWVHVLLWVPLTLAGVMASLRLAKGWLLALEYRNAAREGRIEP